MSEKGQLELLNVLKRISNFSKIRIILTYRTNAIDSRIIEEYKTLAKTEYEFPGVSF